MYISCNLEKQMLGMMLYISMYVLLGDVHLPFGGENVHSSVTISPLKEMDWRRVGCTRMLVEPLGQTVRAYV